MELGMHQKNRDSEKRIAIEKPVFLQGRIVLGISRQIFTQGSDRE
jgi:hypothetical protein